MIFVYAASYSFQSRANVMLESIRKYHKGSVCINVNAEDCPLGTYVPDLAKTRLEAALSALNHTKEDVCIIGADCELYAPLALPSYDVTLVPHVKSTLPDREYMKQIYKTGHANADLILLKNTENTKNIVRWMIDVTEDGMQDGAFYEQTWLSSLPFLFDNVGVMRHAGYNVGYWDANHVEWSIRDGKYYVNNEELVMMQFSGYIKGEPENMSRHSRELCDSPIALELYKNYDERI